MEIEFKQSNGIWTTEDVQAIFWNMSLNLLTAFIICLWFITCKHWWRYLLIIPLIIEIYKFTQIFVVYNSSQSLPYSFVLILLLLIISKKAGFYSKSKNLSSELNMEISELMVKLSKVNKHKYVSIKEKLISLRSKKQTLGKKEYLAELIALQDSMVLLVKK